jgi:enoyl-CoA hydratase/carnithine racemase
MGTASARGVVHAFGEVARDRENKAVIITGTGDDFIADALWGGDTTAVKPDAWDHTFPTASIC